MSEEKSKHSVRFPGESSEYREARNRLLDSEVALRRQVESVAEERRRLPLGGITPTDYEFDELPETARQSRSVRISQLFDDGKDSLIIYSFMYGPQMEQACPLCTSILDGLDGQSPHVVERTNFVVVAKSPIERIMEHAKNRGWRHLRLLSSARTTYNRDYHGETEDGGQLPGVNVFTRRDGKIHHFYGTELMHVPAERGQDPRPVDMIWPLWNLLDYTPEGRGETWRPELTY